MRNPIFTTLLLALILGAFWSSPSSGQYLARTYSKSDTLNHLQSWRVENSSRQDIDDRERDLRGDFINRLIFQSDRTLQEYDSQFTFKSQAPLILSKMIETEKSDSNSTNPNLVFFLTELNDGLKTIIEPQEDILEFIKSFTEFSGLSDPGFAIEFAEDRDYINHTKAVKARPSNDEYDYDSDLEVKEDSGKSIDEPTDLTLENSFIPSTESSRP